MKYIPLKYIPHLYVSTVPPTPYFFLYEFFRIQCNFILYKYTHFFFFIFPLFLLIFFRVPGCSGMFQNISVRGGGAGGAAPPVGKKNSIIRAKLMYRSGKDTVKNILLFNILIDLFLSRNSRGLRAVLEQVLRIMEAVATLSKDCHPKTYNESNSLLHSICDF